MKKEIKEYRQKELEKIANIAKEALANSSNFVQQPEKKKRLCIAKEQPLMVLAKKLSDSLYKSYKKEEEKDCGQLLLEWVAECFWAKVAEDYIPIFKESWELLNKGNHLSEETALSYGDSDGVLWIETNDDKTLKVIIDKSYCRCSDNQSYIYILNEKSDTKHFRIFKAWEKEKLNPNSKDFNDFGYVIEPSIQTFRDFDFDLGVEDSRVKWYVLNYSKLYKRVDTAYYTSVDIQCSLRDLLFIKMAAEK